MSDPHRRVHHLTLAAGVLLIASLTGCAGSALPNSTDAVSGDTPSTSDPSSTPSSDPDATDEPGDPADPSEPVAQSGSQPASILPLDCAELASLAQVQAGFHATVAATITQSSPPPNASRVDFVQAGGLYCAWTGSGGTGLQLGVIPDAASNYAQRVAALTGSGFHDDTLGDGSHVKCTIDAGSAKCVGDILVGDYWISALSSDTAATTESAAVTSYSTVMAGIASAVGGAGMPRGPWTSPTTSGADLSYLCGSPAAAAAALGSGDNGFSVKHASRSTANPSALMSARVGSVGCTWKIFSNEMITFAATDGAAWAYDRMVASGVGTVVSTRFDGAIVTGCPEKCVAYIEYQGGLISVSWLNSEFPTSDAPSYIDDFAHSLGV